MDMIPTVLFYLRERLPSILKNFIEKTILDIQGIFCELFYAEQTARLKGLLQLLDPRIKLLSFLGLIIFGNCLQTVTELAVLAMYILILAVLSRVSLPRMIWRVAALVLVFTGIVTLPSIFNIVRPGEPLWRISQQLYITRQGMSGAILLVMRSFCSISVVYLLTATTQWEELLKSLRVLKIPAPFIMTLEMTHRYIFLGLETASNFFIARKSRSLGKSSGKEGRRFVAHTAGQLFIRTSMAGELVYQAMLSRGYTGEAKSINRFKLGLPDYWWLIFNAALIFGFFIVWK